MWFGMSPDFKVIETRGSETLNFGLLEIKCPSKKRNKDCPYPEKQMTAIHLKSVMPTIIR